MGYPVEATEYPKKPIINKFNEIYGVSPKVCTMIYNDIKTKDLGDAKIEKPRPVNIFFALFWLKNYSYATESRMAAFFKKDEDTLRKYVWKYLKAIQALKEYKVRYIIDFN